MDEEATMATIALRSRRTMAQEIEEALTAAFVSGRFRPGDRLQEDHLCAEFGFTHTPLREALRGLVSRGLVEHLPNRGYRVRVISAAELLQIYQVREGLEGMAARLLAEHVTDEQLAELQALVERILVDGISPDSAQADLDFHRLIAEWSGNTFVNELLLAPQILVRTMLASFATPVVPPGPATDHRLVVRGIASRDPDRAEAAMRAHMRDAAERTVPLLDAPEYLPNRRC
jgi:DNA-binding GntR family transcriptional regulator